MNVQPLDISRRQAIVRSGQVAVRAAVAVMIVMPLAARAKAAKSDFYYQERPKDGKTCATCRLFMMADASKGTCAIVDGEISSSGWCMAYSPRG